MRSTLNRLHFQRTPRVVSTRVYAYVIINKAHLTDARTLLDDADATVAAKVAALFGAITKYGQTVVLPWCRFLQCCYDFTALTEDAHSMLVVEKWDGETPPAMLTAGIASLIYEFGIGALDGYFPRLLADVKAGNGTWAEHLNAWCEQQASLPETRAAVVRALVNAHVAGVCVTQQASYCYKRDEYSLLAL